MPVVITPNMNLPVPVVGVEPGPAYAVDINTCMAIIDNHNHTPGLGAPIPSSALNINSDLPTNNTRLTATKAITFTVQGTPLPGASPDIGALYVSGVDLYYNDINGNQIRLTQLGHITGSPGSISGIISPASASYVTANSEFVWQSGVNTSAGMDSGPLTIRPETAGAPGITINPPTGLSADYSLTLPGALPATTSLTLLDNAGNISAVTTIPTDIWTNSVTANPIITIPNIQISTSSGSFSTNATSFTPVTNLTTTITIRGNPVFIALQGANVSGGGEIEWANESTSGNLFMRVKRDGTVIGGWNLNSNQVSVDISYPPPFLMIDVSATVGVHTYTIEVELDSAASTVSVNNCQLVTYEIL